ncbi:hypothetical protein FOZ62_031933 [Perkinsus olseni]|uniref:Uncharacterized protein n=1 Tax=Perkinsus olseni TaxID=32597 RepID=A0A7J6QYH8_PEROL|nr:hypothetical protein FOZ62_031933 [Perkinsus olseni]
MAELDVSQVVCWCKSLAPAVGSDMAKKIGEYVARRRLDGDHLAEVLRLPQDFISDAQIDGLTMIPANKVRKAWFKEFPLTREPSRESCSLREHSPPPPMWDSPAAASETSLEPCPSLPSMASTAPPVPAVGGTDAASNSAAEIVTLYAPAAPAETCKTVAQQAPRRQEAPVPPPPSRAPPPPRSRRDSTDTRPGSGHSVEQLTGREGRLEAPDFVPTASSTGGGPQHNLTAMLWMQAVIDRLASKANLDRRTAYREIEYLLPEWMWNHLWGAVETSGTKRDSGSSSDGNTSANYGVASSLSATPDSVAVIPDAERIKGTGCSVSSENDDAGSLPRSVGPRRRRKRAAPKKAPRESPKEVLVGLEILRAALAGTGIPTRAVRREPGRSRERTARNSLAKAPSLRNVRRSSVVKELKKRPAMIDTKSSPTCRPSIGGDKNPEQLAEWIRTLPSTQIPSPKLSELADTIVSNGIDGAQMSSSAGLRDLGICNPLESRKLDRFWRNVLAETRAAECARDNAGQIRTGGVQVAL